ncbi:MAG: twin-arginine translocase TatA/TatE family subunit [Leucobacter sp.]
MLQGLTGTHLIVIVFLVVLLFGAPKLPALARSLGQSMKILKQEVSDNGTDNGAESGAGSNAAANPEATEITSKQ